MSLTDVGGQGRLSQASSDLVDPADPAFPFEDRAQPAFIYDSNAVIFAVGSRVITPIDPPVMDGTYYQAVNGKQFTLTLHLTSALANAAITPGSSSVEAGKSLTFSGSVSNLDPTDPLTWSWKVGTTTIPGTGSTVSHQFTAAGDYTVTGTALSPATGSTGSATAMVHVTGGSSTRPPSTSPPPTGPQQGTGGPTAPNVGPVDGTGPRVNGVPTNRPGSGTAAPSFAPASSSVTATATATGDAENVDGTVVGYLLSDATAAAAQRQADSKALDDSATAERFAVTPLRWGWLVGAAVVVVLLALGAGSERRRPQRARRR